MITKENPLSVAEASEFIDKKEQPEMASFIKKFATLEEKKAKALREKLESLDMIKINDRDVTKIIDLLPKDSADLNKILNQVSLDEEEEKKILDLVKEFI
jgi:DNA-directed RNA polymerase subunit F